MSVYACRAVPALVVPGRRRERDIRTVTERGEVARAFDLAAHGRRDVLTTNHTEDTVKPSPSRLRNPCTLDDSRGPTGPAVHRPRRTAVQRRSALNLSHQPRNCKSGAGSYYNARKEYFARPSPTASR